MTNLIIMRAAELLTLIVLMLMLVSAQMRTVTPQYLGSVGWHGGKKKR